MDNKMNITFAHSYKSPLDFILNLYIKFIEICPDEIWNEKFAGWHVSRQIYHALNASAHLFASLGMDVQVEFVPDGGNLALKDGPEVTKGEARTLLESIKSLLDEVPESFDNTKLLQKNEMLSKRFGRDLNNAEKLELIACHLNYHLGACDGALRVKNLPAAFD